MSEHKVKQKQQMDINAIMNTFVAAIISAGGELRVKKGAMLEALTKVVEVTSSHDDEKDELVIRVTVSEPTNQQVAPSLALPPENAGKLLMPNERKLIV